MKNKFKKLIQNASDIIFETDINGNFIFVNDFTLQHLGYSKEEILGRPFTDFIRHDYKEQLSNFYEDLIDVKSDFPTIEFPIIRKDLSTIWGSQKVILNKDSDEKVLGYFGIMRDITILKNLEEQENIRKEKIEVFNKAINYLSSLKLAQFNNFTQVLSQVLQCAAEATKTDLVSYINYQIKEENNEISFNSIKGQIESKTITSEEFYTINFDELEDKKIIIIEDLKKSSNLFFSTQNLIEPEFNSVLVMSVYHNNLLMGVVCFYNEEVNRLWDTEDINFIQRIINIISLSHELQLRLASENKLKYKSQIWSVISKYTQLFLQSKSPFEMFSESFKAIGSAMNIDHMYYYENDSTTNLMIQKYKWGKDNLTLHVKPIQHFTHENFYEIIDASLQKMPFTTLVSKMEHSFLKTLLIDNEIKSIVILPLYFNNVFSGFIGFDSCTEERIWTEDEINILQVFANNISAIVQISKNEQLKDESEERFRLLANNIPGTVYLSKFDEHWSKIYLNDEIKILTGYKKSDFIEGKINFSELIHEEDKEQIIRISASNILKGEKIHLIYRIRTKKNEIKWIEEFADIIKKDGIVEFIEGIYIDITDRKKTESAIKDKEIAQSANKAKSEFLANMSHEIKTHLNGIIGFTDLLMKTVLNKEQEHYMNTVNHSAVALLGIINNILDFSKIEAGKLELEVQPVIIKDFLESIKHVIRFDLERKNLQLKILIDESVPSTLSMDSIRVKQIFLNLVSNAIKFTTEGQITIKIEYKKQLCSNFHKIRMAVEDTGVGILIENQKKIFEPFIQEDNSTTRKYGGTGLGLTITNQLLNLMESKLKVKSSPYLGSIFYFDLLVQEIYSDEKPNTPLKLNTDTIETEHLNMKILIAEDNAINMLLIKTILKALFPKAQLLECINGEQAITKFVELKPDLILMDIQMPLLNGIEATERIRALDPNSKIPIIALTAGTLKEERDLCLSSGMNDFISKPIVKETIKEVILKWIATTEN